MKDSLHIKAKSAANRRRVLMVTGLFLSLLLVETTFAAGCLKASPLSLQRKAAAYAGSIDLAARKYTIDKELIQAVIAVESCFNRKAVSPAGAEGLMQLIPATADRFGVADSFNARQNILAGSRYLKWLLKRYNNNLKFAVAAYNAGEGRVDRYKGIPPFKETKHYVKNVMALYAKLAPQKALANTKTIANGTVYYPYQSLKKANGRVYVQYAAPVEQKPKALTAKPGRQGLDYMKSRAPHLYRKP